MFDALFPSHWSRIRKLYWLNKLKNSVATYEVVVGNPVSFTALASPLRKLQIAFSPVQSGSGDPSPDNVRPISGWDSLTVEMRGKNLAHIGNAPIDETLNGCRLEINGASGHLSGTSTISSGTLPTGYANHYVELPAGTYTLKTTAFNGTGCYFRARWDTFGGASIVNEQGAANGYTFVLTEKRRLYITVGVYGTGSALYKENVDISFDIQIELGSTSTAYVPYNGRSISINLGSTVYSGWVDAVTGIGEVTHESVDMGNLNWGYTSGGQGRFTSGSISAQVKTCTDSEVADVTCEVFPAKSANAIYAGAVGIGINLTTVWVHTAGTDPDAFKTAMSGMKLVYPLATPIPIQLTPQEINSLAGDNVMWTDAANLEVTYRSN